MNKALSESLRRERCGDFPAGIPALGGEEVRELSAGLAPEWQIDDGALTREFSLPTFSAAFGLATRVALLAEAQGHHPDMEVGWGRLIVRLSTHAVGGLSRNDFIVAAHVDTLSED